MLLLSKVGWTVVMTYSQALDAFQAAPPVVHPFVFADLLILLKLWLDRSEVIFALSYKLGQEFWRLQETRQR